MVDADGLREESLDGVDHCNAAAEDGDQGEGFSSDGGVSK